MFSSSTSLVVLDQLFVLFSCSDWCWSSVSGCRGDEAVAVEVRRLPWR